MISLDTDVLVRFLTRDDEAQFQKAYALFDRHDVYLCETVILETEWVLRHAYAFSASAINDAMKRLMNLPNVHLPDPNRIYTALEWHGKGLDFADALHLAGSQQAQGLVTFDKKFIKSAEGLGACPVRNPDL